MTYILQFSESLERFASEGGGKAKGLAQLVQAGVPVPPGFCISTRALEAYLEHHALADRLRPGPNLAAFEREIEALFLAHPLPEQLRQACLAGWQDLGGRDAGFAVRSSGTDEDSAEHSFAGLFSSFLDQRGKQALEDSIRRCWASGYSERALRYRIERGLPISDLRIAVVVQRMVAADCAGVAFTRNPAKPLDRDELLIESVWGLGEGLVSGELDADRFEVARTGGEFTPTLADKTHAIRPDPVNGVCKVELEVDRRAASSLRDDQVAAVASLALDLERRMGMLLDIEWAIEADRLYCVQMRPITSLPVAAFYCDAKNGYAATLWDNSNIVESFSGVTSPLTFSFASFAYQTVYFQIAELLGVPKPTIVANEARFRNLLGLIRGRIYYNLGNWYRLLMLLPGSASNPGFMETMMGVKKDLRAEDRGIFDFVAAVAPTSLVKRLKLALTMGLRFLRSESIIRAFKASFDEMYERHRRIDYTASSLPELSAHYSSLQRDVLYRWQAPIVNDFLCMMFFGSLKRLTHEWVEDPTGTGSLQNDLLCGQGHLESTEPTKCLMRIAAGIDRGDARVRELFCDKPSAELLELLRCDPAFAESWSQVREFLDRFGFRCVDELKLEERDLNEDPTFAIQAIASYVRTKAYSIDDMLARETRIRSDAEARVKDRVKGIRRLYFFWVLNHARRAVRHREDLRFDRTKIYGLCRRIFRAMGDHLHSVGALAHPRDVFHLTVDELLGWIDGRAVTLSLASIVDVRKREFAQFERTPAPPDRFVTYGAVGASLAHPNLLAAGDLLTGQALVSADPNVLLGTPCSPGIVEGEVLVVHRIADAAGLDGQIIVTSRTDPGWVPLYPSCSGLLIERGSLLSHSAVVARELGVPTIVGISGGLMTRLRSGMRVRMDGQRGEVRILE